MDIHKFYARQHFKQNIMFEQQSKLEVLKHADLNCFCKDFDIPISNKTQLEIYKKVSPQQKPFDFEMFKEAIPKLGLEMAKNKALETKYRLKELKNVLEYPDSEIPDSIKKIMSNKTQNYGRQDTNETAE